MRRLAVLSLPLVLVACGGLPRLETSAPAAAPPPAAPRAENNPSAVIAAPSSRVRAVIASRAQSRGTKVASNTAGGVVLERELSQSAPAVVEQCGAHKPGRIVRVVLSTSEVAGQTRVEERRFIVDDGTSCQLRLSPEEIEQANKGLQEIGNQVTGRAA